MPNKPRPENPARPIRFDTLWPDILAIAKRDGVTASEVVREAVRRYIKHRGQGAGKSFGTSQRVGLAAEVDLPVLRTAAPTISDVARNPDALNRRRKAQEQP